MKLSNRVTMYAGALMLSLAAACNSDKTTSPAEPAGVSELRSSLEVYPSFDLAKNGGYNTAITDCMSNGDIGAMGYHYGNGALIDGNVDPLHPEVLVFEPGPGGAMNLVGVEFIVPFAVLPKTAAPPVLFGQQFAQNDLFQVWALHVWTHRANPSGLFAPWNPRVHC